jgi:MFS family permease
LVPAELLLTTVILAAANLVFGPRAAALAEAAAPPEVRGRYLAAFQYAFTVAGVVAPAVVALFAVAVWLPWALVASTAGAAVVGLGMLASHLPAAALSPENLGDPGAEPRENSAVTGRGGPQVRAAGSGRRSLRLTLRRACERQPGR